MGSAERSPHLSSCVTVLGAEGGVNATMDVLRLRKGRSSFGDDYQGDTKRLADALQSEVMLSLLLGDDGSLRGVVLCNSERVWLWGFEGAPTAEATHIAERGNAWVSAWLDTPARVPF